MAEESKDVAGHFRQDLKRTVDPNQPTFYANDALIVSTQWDTQLYFSTIRAVEHGKFGQTNQFVVIMTAEHALRLMEALQHNLSNFQKQHGPIRKVEKDQMTGLADIEPPPISEIKPPPIKLPPPPGSKK